MVALQIRNVSPETRDTLARRAKARGQSLQAYLHELLEADAGRNRNREILARIAARNDGTHGEPGEIEEQIRQDRRQREAYLAGLLD